MQLPANTGEDPEQCGLWCLFCPFFFPPLDMGYFTLEIVSLNARPENLSWALLLIHVSCALLPSSRILPSLRISLPQIQPSYRAVAFRRQPATAGSVWSG